MLKMGIEEYLGLLRPIITQLSQRVSQTLVSIGIDPPSNIPQAILITLIILIITSIVIISNIWTASSNSTTSSSAGRRDINLILGISGDNDLPSVGKTTLFKSLKYGHQPKHGTTTSMEVNDSIINISNNKQIRLVDFPGHSRLRPKLQPYLHSSKSILFIIDSKRFATQARRDAQLLHHILTDSIVSNSGTPLLVILNKRDEEIEAGVIPLSIRTAKDRLEAELERIKVASAATLKGATVTDDNIGIEEERAPLGYDNESFSFDHVRGPVRFCDASAKTGDIGQVTKFLDQCN